MNLGRISPFNTVNDRAQKARLKLAAKVRRLGFSAKELTEESVRLRVALMYPDWTNLARRPKPALSLRKIPLALRVVDSLVKARKGNGG